MAKKDSGRNRVKEDVRKRGGIFNIHEGFNWTKSTDLDVHLVLTPRVGSHNIGITSGVHTPGMEFEPHIHPLSEELVFCHEGEGEFFLYDRWFPVKKGDVLYAPPGVRHGTRKPADQEGVFVTIGVATPPQLDLYNRIGYDPLEEDGPKKSSAGVKKRETGKSKTAPEAKKPAQKPRGRNPR